MDEIDFTKVNDLRNDNCPDFFYYGGRRYEYLLEYKNNNSYSYAILCDVCPSIGYPYFHPQEGDLRFDLLRLQGTLQSFYRFRYYFRAPWWKRLWESIF